jgi:hypothetical protein
VELTCKEKAAITIKMIRNKRYEESRLTKAKELEADNYAKGMVEKIRRRSRKK